MRIDRRRRAWAHRRPASPNSDAPAGGASRPSLASNGSRSFSIAFTIDVDPRRCTLDQLQRDLRRESRRALAQALLDVIAQVDATLAVDNPPCTRCGGRIRSRGRTSRRIVTMFGTIAVRRARYACITCRTVHRPFDDWLLDGVCGEYSRAVCEQALYLAAELAYERAAEVLQHVTGVAMSGRQIQRILDAEGERLTQTVRGAADFETAASHGEVQRRFRHKTARQGAELVNALRHLKTSGRWSAYWTGVLGPSGTPPSQPTPPVRGS
jgi:hypothetical protein